MRTIRDVLRLTAAGMSSRKIAASLVVSATTVVDCLQRARAAGVSWPLLDDLSDEALEARLFVSVGITSDTAQFAVQSIRCWLERMGRQRYPNAEELTITADCGE